MARAEIVVRHEVHISDEARQFLAHLIRPVVSGLTRLETHMSAVDDALATIGSSVDELVKDVQRLIDAFTSAGTLTPEQQAAVDALQGKLTAIDDAVEAVTPEPVAEPTI